MVLVAYLGHEFFFHPMAVIFSSLKSVLGIRRVTKDTCLKLPKERNLKEEKKKVVHTSYRSTRVSGGEMLSFSRSEPRNFRGARLPPWDNSN